MDNMVIEFKLDIGALLRNNPRETVEIVAPKELRKYETMEMTYGKVGA